MWEFLDSNLFQSAITAVAILGAFVIAKKQDEINKAIHRTQDSVELYAVSAVRRNNDGKAKDVPCIYVQNVGTRLIYLDKYIFNGRIYEKYGQILPSTYSQAVENFYWIELPQNGELHVSLSVFYRDQENRRWSSDIFADAINGVWEIRTLPRKSVT